MLKIEGVSAGYLKTPVLRDVSLLVDKGISCIVGANGSGKSTLMKVISGLLKPTAGKVSFEDVGLVGLPTHQIVDQGVILVPEGRQLFPKMTVSENLLLGARNKRARSEAGVNFEKVFVMFPVLAQRKNQLAGTLSGGEQQMVAMARGLMASPKILLLDEPSMGLSPIMTEMVFRAVKELSSHGVTVLLVEQNVRVSLMVSQRGFLLEQGRITLSGDSKQLIDSDVIKKGYLGG